MTCEPRADGTTDFYGTWRPAEPDLAAAAPYIAAERERIRQGLEHIAQLYADAGIKDARPVLNDVRALLNNVRGLLADPNIP